MAAKKRTKKKKTTAKKTTRKKPAPPKKAMKRKKVAPAKKKSVKKKSVKKKSVKKKAAPKAKPARKKPSAKPARAARRQSADVTSYPREDARARSAGQSGSLQGLSDIQRANSESVDELLEEGNTFEAEAVRGVEEAGNADEEEVHTHEVSEDDIPGEYLDKD